MDLSPLILPTFDQSSPERVCPDVTVGEIGSVASAVAATADPHKARGVRHSAFGLVLGIMVAILAGARSTLEIAGPVQDLSSRQRGQIALTWNLAPSLSTIRRFLLALEQAVRQDALNAWAQAHAARIAATQNGLRHFMMDGKSQRAAACKARPQPHLMGVLDIGDTDVGARLRHRTEKRVVPVTSIGHRDEQIVASRPARRPLRQTQNPPRTTPVVEETRNRLRPLHPQPGPAQTVREQGPSSPGTGHATSPPESTTTAPRSGNLAAHLATLRNAAIRTQMWQRRREAEPSPRVPPWAPVHEELERDRTRSKAMREKDSEDPDTPADECFHRARPALMRRFPRPVAFTAPGAYAGSRPSAALTVYEEFMMTCPFFW
ncbi:transposase family protein [Kineosporia mesophila]|uniref:transposase family protein n=1 Tax=Kineosporia mesophila TaxID=566012 RepID=UPI001E3EAF0D|nr:transposase family protein [Kineosporia mesophila]